MVQPQKQAKKPRTETKKCKHQEQFTREYLQKLEQEINKKAHSLATQFLATEAAANSSYEKVFLIYKFDSTPADIIVEGML